MSPGFSDGFEGSFYDPVHFGVAAHEVARNPDSSSLQGGVVQVLRVIPLRQVGRIHIVLQHHRNAMHG